MMRTGRRSSIKQRLILVVMAVVLVPVGLWSVFWVQSVSERYSRQQLQSTQWLVERMSAQIEQQIAKLKSEAYLLANDTSLSLVVRYPISNAEIVEYVLRALTPTINTIKGMNQMVRRVSVVHSNPHLFNVGNRMYYYENFAERLRSLHRTDGKGLLAVEYRRQGYLYAYTENSAADSDVWYITSAIDNSRQFSPDALVEIMLDNRVLAQQILDIRAEGTGDICLVTKDGQVPVSTLPGEDICREVAAKQAAGADRIDLDGVSYSILHADIDALRATVLFLLPSERLHLTPRDYLYMLPVVLTVIGGLYFLAYILSKLVFRELLSLSEAIDTIELSKLGGRIPVRSHDEVGNIASHINDMTARLQQSIGRQQEMIYNELVSQMRPHFICNAMDMMRLKAEKSGDDHTARLALLIAQYFRHSVMRSVGLSNVAQEVRETQDYIQLANEMREDAVACEVEMDEYCEENAAFIAIPRFILQPIVENAFRHGLKEYRYGYVVINARRQNGDILLSVEDNGTGLPEAELCALRERLRQAETPDEAIAGGVGLVNVQVRLKIQYGERCSLTIGPSRLGGMRVALRMPAE